MSSYAYIVIGAGSAGIPAAVRLAQGQNEKVLLLDAGPRPVHPWTRMPMAVGKMLGKSLYFRRYFTEPDPAMADRKIFWPRGQALGGSSTVNGMMWVHGTPHAFDHWTSEGCTGWGWADVHPWFQRIENYQQGRSDTRGHEGPVTVTEFQPVDPGPDAWLDSLQASGVGKRVKDYNDKGIGGSYLQFNTRRGRRQSTFDAYLQPNQHLGNLEVLTGCHVKRLLIENGRVTGLIALQGTNEITLKASKEIILSAGSFSSPQILELSGIGRREVLQAQGIPVVHELPMVGENLSEHVHSPISFRCKPGISWNHRLTSKSGQFMDGARWALMGTGRLSSLSMTAHAFVSRDPASERADLKLQISQISLPGNRGKDRVALDPFDGIALASFQITPHSRGTCHIGSTDPLAAPILQSNHLSDSRDLDACIDALKMSRRIASARPLADWLLEEIRPGTADASDEALVQHLRTTGATAFHPVGTCRMGPSAADSVVGPDLRVHGLPGLRIADTSIMPDIAATNTNAIAIVIGERVADFVLR